ncbi:MAG TPA: hypothetical protein VIQ31_02835 [Phormidium sp.]
MNCRIYTELKNVFEDYEEADKTERANLIRSSQVTQALKHQGLYSDFLSSPGNQTFVDEMVSKLWFQTQLPFVPQIGMSLMCGLSDFDWDDDTYPKVIDVAYDLQMQYFLVQVDWSLHNQLEMGRRILAKVRMG